MRRVRISVDIDDEVYSAFQREGQRRNMSVESLLEQTVQGLLKEMHREESEGTDHPIIAS